MYTCRFFPGWVVNSLFLMATRRSFSSSAISAPGYKCPPWTSGVRIPPKGCGMCLRFCLFTSCTTPTLIGWIWHKFRGGWWNIVYCLRLMRFCVNELKYRVYQIHVHRYILLNRFISLAIIMNAFQCHYLFKKPKKKKVALNCNIRLLHHKKI